MKNFTIYSCLLLLSVIFAQDIHIANDVDQKIKKILQDFLDEKYENYKTLQKTNENLQDQILVLKKHLQKVKYEKQNLNELLKKYKQQLRKSRVVESEYWIAVQCKAKELANESGKIDANYVNIIANKLKENIKNNLDNVTVKRVRWNELNKQDSLGIEQQQGLLKFVERSTISQSTSQKNWYSSFDLAIDRSTLDKCPFGNKWVYIKTHSLQADGSPGKEIKLKLFKRNGLSLDAYPSRDYTVEILNYGDSWSSHREVKVVRVTGITTYTNFHQPHTSSQIKGGPRERIRLDIFYKDRVGEKKISSVDNVSPPIVDFQIHPASVILLRINGKVTSHEIRSTISEKFEMFRGNDKERWSASVQNGPVLLPSVFSIQNQ
ncbi:hypothetical protein [Candidatus Uabimicrobium sp. HlEnr_7]|uniref:hypothetical protein n=1 Tax=Candidatus Uabimicrobium helgolandensis TaxID=3095367 RepID=UPI003556A950